MTKRLKILLIGIISALCFSCLFAGCKIGLPSLSKILSGYNGVTVTYFGNGGQFENSKGLFMREVHYGADGDPFYEIPQEEGFSATEGSKISYSGNDLIGWYLPKRYESGEHQGEIIYYYQTEDNFIYPNGVVGDRITKETVFENQTNKNIAANQVTMMPDLTKKITSAQNMYKSNGESVIVCAMWMKKLSVDYVLVYDGTIEGTEEGVSYENGTVLESFEFGKNQTFAVEQIADVSLLIPNFKYDKANYAFVGFYENEACTRLASNIARPEEVDGQTPNAKVYVKFLSGEWDVIKSAEDVQRIFLGANNANKKFFIRNDIDCTYSTGIMAATNFKCTVKGNDSTLSNLKFTATSSASTYSPFGNIAASASITDLTIKDMTVIVKNSAKREVYAICSSCADGATLTNLTFDIIKTEYTGTDVENVEEGYLNNWLFGDMFDSLFFAAHTGITVTGEHEHK